jgi:acylpyruvate hydrolase
MLPSAPPKASVIVSTEPHREGGTPMRLATIAISGQHRPAVILGDQVLDLIAARATSPAARLLPGSILEILAAEDAGRALLDRAIKETEARVPLASVKLAAPIPHPRMVLAIGANYRAHLEEMNTAIPMTPVSFHKNAAEVTGTGDDIVLPAIAPTMVDWEGEFAVVIGRRCHAVAEADALSHVAGYTIVNDVSARDWVAPAFTASGLIPTITAWEHNVLGKLFPTFCPIGPWIVTAEEIADPHNLAITTRLNGQVMQSSNTNDLVFNVAQIIAHYSRFLTFLPGDIISTGSPSGVGFGMKPQVFMKNGDTIEVEIEGIGRLRNQVVQSAG